MYVNGLSMRLVHSMPCYTLSRIIILVQVLVAFGPCIYHLRFESLSFLEISFLSLSLSLYLKAWSWSLYFDSSHCPSLCRSTLWRTMTWVKVQGPGSSHCPSLCRSTLCLKKNIPDVFSYNSRKHYRIFIIFGRNITETVSNQKMLYFLPHLINASALPCKTENTENVSFHVNVSCWFANRHTSHIGILSPNNCWTIFHS